MVDIDLEKFFDRVNLDRLMARVAQRVADKRVLKLIRAFLNGGVMENGLVRSIDEGTPQGGPLSPLLSNLVLDELDKELERRGHRFCRYAEPFSKTFKFSLTPRECIQNQAAQTSLLWATQYQCLCQKDAARLPSAFASLLSPHFLT